LGSMIKLRNMSAGLYTELLNENITICALYIINIWKYQKQSSKV
jgi:hypothetical protein